MEEAKKLCFKTLPTISHARQSYDTNTSNNISMSPSPSPSEKAVAPPKRIINKIPLDFSKLKQSRLHRTLAQAILSKQGTNPDERIASATTISRQTSPSAGELSTEASFATLPQHEQRQQREESEYQSAPMSADSNQSRNFGSPEQQSLNIKALIKHRLLNKLHNSAARQIATTTVTTTTSKEQSFNSGQSNDFAIPKTQAVVPMRSKPPLLLNLVNQLPKHRATCGGNGKQSRRHHETPPTPPKSFTPPVSASASSTSPTPSTPPTRAALFTSPPPLIVLEHKVLAPNEKIDLSALRLPNGQSSSTVSSPKEIRHADKLKITSRKPTEMAKTILNKLQANSGINSTTKKKIILNASKLKMPREQLAQLAKEVRRQAMQQQQQMPSPNTLATRAVPALTPIPVTRKIRLPVLRSDINSVIASDSHTSLMNPITDIPPETDIHTSLITPSVEIPDSSMSKVTTSINCNENSTIPIGSEKSSSPPPSIVKSEPSGNEISAVDFIAQLTANNAIDVANYAELSAEELSMSAKFSPALSVKMEQVLPIGKILQMEDMDIMHATLNVNGNEPNVLSISPNAIKLQSSVIPNDHKCASKSDNTPSFLDEPLETTAPKYVDTITETNTILSNPPTLVVTVPPKMTKDDDTLEKPSVEAPEPTVNKEENPLTDPVQFRTKKPKINLVQRNKRSVSKTNESSTEKKTDEPVGVSYKMAETTTKKPDQESDTESVSKEFNKAGASEDFTEKDTSVSIIPELIRETPESIKVCEKEATTLDSEINIESVVKPTTNDKDISTDTEPVITEESAKQNELLAIKSTKKIPKHKQKVINENKNNNNMVSKQQLNDAARPSVSLVDVLTQEQPPPQGEPPLPFRSNEKTNAENSMEQKSSEAKGIQNLLTHLAAENVVSQSKQVKSEETAKVPRKKLLKTRPVLNAKRSTKVLESKTNTAATPKLMEASHPRKRALLADSKENGSNRGFTSSTSDDDGDVFRGFIDEPLINSKGDKHLKINETDISDDATPDYDETEDEPQLNIVVSKSNKLKTEPTAQNQQTETTLKPVMAVEVNQENFEKIEENSNQENFEKLEENASNADNMSSETKSKEYCQIPEVEKPNKQKSGAGLEKNDLETKTTISVNHEDEKPENIVKGNLAKKRVAKKTTQMQESELQNKRKRPRLGNIKAKGVEADLESASKESNTNPPTVNTKSANNSNTETNADIVMKEASTSQNNRKRPRRSVKETVKNESESTVPVKMKSTENADTKPLIESAKNLETVVKGRRRRSRNQKSGIAVAPVDTTTSETSSPNAKQKSKEAKKPGQKQSKTQPVLTSTPDPLIQATPKRRGAQPKPMQFLTPDAKSSDHISDFKTRLLLIRKREQLESEEELREDGRGKGAQQCGLCLVRCNNWQDHLGEHYGVGWLVGEPQPLLTRSNVMKMMKTYIDAGNKRLSCRLCNRSLTTSLGMLLHLENCGAKERIVCPDCNTSYTKLSYSTHSRSCPMRPRQPSEEKVVTETSTDNDVNTQVYSNAGRFKRKSTLKAESKLVKIAAQMKKQCDDEPFKSKDHDDNMSDYDVSTENETTEESGSEGVDSNEDEANASNINSSLVRKLRTTNKSRISQKSLYGRINVENVAKDRWNYFTRENYAKGVLYPHLLPHYEKLSPDDTIKFLPSNDSTSMRYGYKNVEDQAWMQLAPLEGFSEKDEYICYLGSAIKELAWVPLPSTVKTQYLLCSQRNKMNSFARSSKDKKEDALLLLLECKMSPADGDNVKSLVARLHYGICVREEAVHTFAFIPSGGYDESNNRLGLLAVGSSLRTVIYALPLHPTKKNSAKGKEKKLNDVIILKPVLTLTVDMENHVRDPCTKICWSESSGHNLLVSGYSSGNIAFWDISDEQGLNFIKRDNQRHFLPANVFYFGERNISYLELHYDTNGARWLAVGAIVRKLWVYDILNWSQPLPIVGDSIHNLFLGCLSWSPLWDSLVVGVTEVYKYQYPRLLTHNPSGINFDHNPLDSLLRSPRSLHFDSEQLTLATVTDNGDITFIQTNQLNRESQLKKPATKCRAVCATDACYLNGTSEPDSISAEDFQRDYGLLLKPLTNVPYANIPTYRKSRQQHNFDMLSCMRLNSVRWNWNNFGLNWVAVGAEHGLLRFVYFDRTEHFSMHYGL